jgi:hypothetical protein
MKIVWTDTRHPDPAGVFLLILARVVASEPENICCDQRHCLNEFYTKQRCKSPSLLDTLTPRSRIFQAHGKCTANSALVELVIQGHDNGRSFYRL